MVFSDWLQSYEYKIDIKGCNWIELSTYMEYPALLISERTVGNRHIG